MAAIELYSTSLYSDANLVSYYRLEGNSNDAKGVNNGSDTSCAYSSGYGVFNQGLGLTASSPSYVTLGTDSSLNPSTAITIVMWFNVSNITSNSRLVARDDVGSNRAYDLGFGGTSGGADRLYWWVKTASSSLSIQNDTNLGNVLHHVAAVYDGSYIKLYVDGVLDCTPGALTGNISSASTNTYIGRRGDGLYVTGTFDDVAIFSRALTATEVSNLYTGTWPASGGNPSRRRLLGIG